MKCKVQVFLINEHFSQEHADKHFGGKASANNREFDWEDELRISSNVTEVNVNRKATFSLEGQLSTGEQFQYDIEDMFLFEIQSKDAPVTYVGCSESLLERFEKKKEKDMEEVCIYLKDYEPYANPLPGIYIASKAFPKELI